MNTISDAYKKAYSRLNDEQKNAVDQIDGPVMVLAGPGTGKTQILAARVGNILLQTDTRAEEILCLTFTDAGVRAMRKRLLEFIGPEAFKIEIHTFHSFCNSVIQQNLEQFAISELEVLSDIEEIELYRELIDRAGYPLKKKTTEAYFEKSRLKNLFEFLQKENIDYKVLLNTTKEYIKEIPSLQEFQYKRKYRDFEKGDPNPRLVEKEVKSMEALTIALKEYPNYKNLLEEYKRFTYSDMILWVIAAFKKNKNLLADYQERFQHFFVDEYQDTSGAQQEILHLLTSFWPSPNLFVVGDDDQAIYRFQGASLENVVALYDKYVKENLLFVNLKRNYRSSQILLDRAKFLIEKNKNRLAYVVDKIEYGLESATDYKDLAQDLQLDVYQDANTELAAVTQKVEALIKSGTAPSEIAILYRKHKQVDELLSYFASPSNSIPFTVQKDVNVLATKVVNRLLLVLNWINSETNRANTGTHHYLEMIFSGLCPVSLLCVSKIARLKQATKDLKKLSWRELLNEVQDHEVLSDLLEDSEQLALKNFSELMEMLLERSLQYPLQDIVSEIIRESKLIPESLNNGDGNDSINYLLAFYNYIKDGIERKYFSNVKDFIQHLYLVEKYDLRVNSRTILGDKDGVQLSTVHGVKGLEYENVFLIGCLESEWSGKKNRRHEYKFPPESSAFNLSQDAEELLMEDERRLFYVAMTRAKTGLYISYYKLKDEKEVKPAKQLVELMEQNNLEPTEAEVSEDVLKHFLISTLSFSRAPEVELINESLLKNFKENYSLSATHLNNYVKCPLSFYFNNVLRIPSKGSPAMAYGNSLHYALEHYIGSVDRESKSEEMLKKSFLYRMKVDEGAFPDERGYTNYIEKGLEAIGKYYNQKLSRLEEKADVEKKFSAEINGAFLNGRVDKSVVRNGEQIFIDYKTGNPIKVKEQKRTSPPLEKEKLDKKRKPTHYDLNGGDYWRQAVFYKLLADFDSNAKSIDKFIFEMLDPNPDTGELMEEEVLIQPEHEKTVLKQIEFTWNGIRNNDFSQGCGDEHCHWCNFVKRYNLK